MKRLIVAGLAALALVGTARADLVIPTPEPPGPNTKIADDALNAALDAVQDRDHACRLQPPPHNGGTTHDPPPQDILDAFAVLRRPATPDDALPIGLGVAPLGGPVAVDYVRRARVLPNGMAVYLLPMLQVPRALPKPPERCFFNERIALEHRLRGKPAPVQRQARRMLRSYQRSLRAVSHLAPQSGVFVFVKGARSNFGSTSSDVTSIRERGTLSVTEASGHRALVVGLIPDGVARIDYEFARGHGILPGSSRFYRHVYRRSAAVVDNVVALTVPRAPLDVLFHREVWRAADGSIVNVVPAPTAG
jgi:hypothetical protein